MTRSEWRQRPSGAMERVPDPDQIDPAPLREALGMDPDQYQQEPPHLFSLTGGRGVVHEQYAFRAARMHGTVLVTSKCGQVYNLRDLTRADSGPTCKRCQSVDRRWAR